MFMDIQGATTEMIDEGCMSYVNRVKISSLIFTLASPDDISSIKHVVKERSSKSLCICAKDQL